MRAHGDGRALLCISGLRKSYGPRVALAGVDLDVRPCEIVALLGPNGAGKTTLVSIVAGARAAGGGAVSVGGVDALHDPRSAQPLIGWAPQELGVYPSLPVRDNLALLGSLAGVPRRELPDRIDSVAHELDLSELLDRIVGTLSGGQQRRVHTAMALLHHPRLLMLDEPTVGADVESRARILEVVRQRAASGCAVVYCTHYLGEVEALDATVAILHDGQIAARGRLDELVSALGAGAVELIFAGAAPTAVHHRPLERNGSMLRIPINGDTPSETVAAALSTLGPDAHRLRDVRIVVPGIESVYLSVTGQKMHTEDASEL